MNMRKATALMLSLFALAYVGLAYADEDEREDSSQGEQKESRETSKREWGQKREIVKAEWEQKREVWKTEREDAIEKWKLEKEKLRSEFKAKFTTERCAKIEEKIQNRTDKFEGAKEKHASVYTNLVNRIQKFIDRFKAFNETSATDVDPAKIKEVEDDLATLKTMIADFKTSYADYFAKLSATKKFTCGSSEGEFRGSLVDTRAYLKAVHTNAAEIRKFVRTEILPDILAAKKEMAKIKGETKNEDADEEDKDEDRQEEVPATVPTTPTSNQ